MKRFTKLAIKRGHLIGAAVVVGSSLCLAALASTVTLPNVFTAGTPASAAQVNANFSAIKSAVDDNFSRLPRVWASTNDKIPGIGASGITEISKVTINAPATGVIMISGSATVINGGPEQPYLLWTRVDGRNLFGTASAQHYARAFSEVGAEGGFNMGYTVTVPISAGTHTISMWAGPNTGTTGFLYGRNHLSVIYFPASQSNVTPDMPPL